MRKKPLVVSIGLLAAAAGVAVVLIGRRGTATSPPAPGQPGAADRVVPVLVVAVEKRDLPIVLQGLGTVTPLAQVTVRSQVDGRLDKVVFTEGQNVKKGDVLAQIDSRPYVIQLQQAEAAKKRDKAQADNAKATVARNDRLQGDNLVTQQQVDDQKALAAQLEGSLAADEAQAAAARLSIDFARITSPIDGVAGVRLVDPGNVVRASDTQGIVLITQLDPIGVIFTLPQDDLGRVVLAQSKGKLPVVVFGRDGKEKIAEGELLVIDNQVNAQTSTVRLKAVFPNPARKLWPQAFVRAEMTLGTEAGALVVPSSAVQRGPSGAFVYTVDGDKAATKAITVGATIGETTVVEKGLAVGDRVVTDGQNQLRPGARVSIRGGTPTGRGEKP